jgi:hypothetical protein
MNDQPNPASVDDYPNPTEADLKDPDFEAVWDAIKEWDLSRFKEHKSGLRSYAGATGNDVMHILLALKHSASQLPVQTPASLAEIVEQAAGELYMGGCRTDGFPNPTIDEIKAIITRACEEAYDKACEDQRAVTTPIIQQLRQQ